MPAATRVRPAAPQQPLAQPITRDLPNGATFADVVRVAAALLNSGRGASNEGCLLRTGEAGQRLSADLMPALSELPDPPVDLDARMKLSGGLGLLSAWGAMPSEPPEQEPALLLASFSAVSAISLRGHLSAIVLTDQGAYIRNDDEADATDRSPRPAASAVQAWLVDPKSAGATLYITAEAAVAVTAIEALLRSVPATTSVAFAVALPEGTRRPRASAVEPTPGQLCPDGLPEPGADMPEGALDPGLLVQALAPLRANAARCLDRAHGSARAGGRITLALRIAADGHVLHACLLRDATRDADLTTCVLDSALGLRLPPPTPSGFVDVHLPLNLAPSSAPAQRGVCD
jgi:hypothetical protein